MLTLTFISPTCPERGGTLPGSIAAGRERARASRCRSPADDAARAGTQPAADSNPAAPAPAAPAPAALLPLLPLLLRRRRRLVVSVVAAVLRRVLATVLPANLVVTRVRWHLGLGLRRERVHVSLLLLVILRLLRRRLLKRRLLRRRLELGVGVIKLVEERHVVTRVGVVERGTKRGRSHDRGRSHGNRRGRSDGNRRGAQRGNRRGRRSARERSAEPIRS